MRSVPPGAMPVTLTDDERLVATAVLDIDLPTAAAVADYCSLGQRRRFGNARASATLGMLVRRGIVVRHRPAGSAFTYEYARRPTDEERG